MSQAQPYRKRKRNKEEKLGNQKRKRDEELELEHQFQRELPCDAMEMIFSFINDWRSRIRFRAVCKAWRWVAEQYARLKPMGQPAWIMLSKYSDSDSRDFFSFSDGVVTHTIHMPEAREMHCCGSSQGWLIMQKYNEHQYLNKFILLNPISKTTIPLPLEAKVKSSSRGEYQILPMKIIKKVILSAAPAPKEDCLVAAIDIDGSLYLCRTTDRWWTKQHYKKYNNFKYEDVLFYKRSIYGIENDGGLYMVLSFRPDLNFKAERFFMPITRLMSMYNDRYRYLAECCGKVVLIFRYKGNYSQIGYRVCDLESERDVYLESFGDGVLLLDNSSCRYLPIKDGNATNMEGNCIYVTCSICEFRYHSVHLRNHGNGVFEWEKGRFGRNESRYVWYTPNIHI